MCHYEPGHHLGSCGASLSSKEASPAFDDSEAPLAFRHSLSHSPKLPHVLHLDIWLFLAIQKSQSPNGLIFGKKFQLAIFCRIIYNNRELCWLHHGFLAHSVTCIVETTKVGFVNIKDWRCFNRPGFLTNPYTLYRLLDFSAFKGRWTRTNFLAPCVRCRPKQAHLLKRRRRVKLTPGDGNAADTGRDARYCPVFFWQLMVSMPSFKNFWKAGSILMLIIQHSILMNFEGSQGVMIRHEGLRSTTTTTTAAAAAPAAATATATATATARWVQGCHGDGVPSMPGRLRLGPSWGKTTRELQV